MSSHHRRPKVMVLDGDNDNAIQVATELSEDTDPWVIGVGTSTWSRLLRSKYCDVGVTTVPSGDPRYARRIRDIVISHEPDLLVPIGHHSVVAADEIRESLPEMVTCWLPPSDSLDVTVDKSSTADLAAELHIDTPADYTAFVTKLDERGRPGKIDELPFPIFVKARHERGKNITANVDEPAAFWNVYDELVDEAADGVIVQEYIDGDRTYGCGLLYEDGDPQLLVGHEEIRSVPRHGGSGTRVRLFRDPRIEAASLRLLDHLDWHGPALVEFKRRPDGSYVLMEINAKLWASYALASQSGYRFVSTLATRALELPGPATDREPKQVAEKVFPLRELYFAVTTSEESVLRSLASMCWPPASPDLNMRDIGAWVTPPASLFGGDETTSETASDAIPADNNATDHSHSDD